MREVQVWAPKSRSVRLLADGALIPMKSLPMGWWTADIPHGRKVDYGFVLDGDPLPDPRSPSQPAGVHALSQTVNHGSFRWSDAGWQPPALETGILYELH